MVASPGIGAQSSIRPRHAWLIVNPTAGAGAHAEEVRGAAGSLVEHGWTVRGEVTHAAGDGVALARRAAAAGAEVVVVAGGDGTVNEVANGLVGSTVALAVLPAGTGNVLAAQLGMVGVPTPLFRPDLRRAAELLRHGVVRTVDVGLARRRDGTARHFMLWAGIGWDAGVAQTLETAGRDLKRTLGPAAYGAVGLRALLLAAGTPSLVRCDRHRVRAPLLMAVVANAPLYAGAVRLLHEARLDDGHLDVSLFLGRGVAEMVRHLVAVIARRRAGSRRRLLTPARRIRILARRPLPVHLDAEPFGRTPLTIEVVPRALRLLVPPSVPPDVFSTPAAEEACAAWR